MCESSVKIRYKLLILLDGSRKSIQASKPIGLFLMADPGRFQRPSQKTERLVIRLQRYRKRMPVLSSVREREPCRVKETGWRPVDHLGDEGQRLKRPRAEILPTAAGQIHEVLVHTQQPAQIPAASDARVPRERRDEQAWSTFGTPKEMCRRVAG